MLPVVPIMVPVPIIVPVAVPIMVPVPVPVPIMVPVPILNRAKLVRLRSRRKPPELFPPKPPERNV
jgi:hypothetical protein